MKHEVVENCSFLSYSFDVDYTYWEYTNCSLQKPENNGIYKLYFSTRVKLYRTVWNYWCGSYTTKTNWNHLQHFRCSEAWKINIFFLLLWVLIDIILVLIFAMFHILIFYEVRPKIFLSPPGIFLSWKQTFEF